jgi:hypothetical protein
MDFVLKIIASAGKFVEWASIKKVLMLTMFCFLALILFTGYEERARIGAALSNAPTTVAMKRFTVTDDLAVRIRALVGSPIVSMVVVYAADLQLNERIAMYRFSDNPLITEMWDKHILEFGASHAVFTKDDVSNTLMVAVVNGEFACYKYGETINRLLVPKAPVPAVCYVSLPPYYGSFAGFMEVSLTRMPSHLEQQAIEIEMKRLSNDIFFKNIVPGLSDAVPKQVGLNFALGYNVP